MGDRDLEEEEIWSMKFSSDHNIDSNVKNTCMVNMMMMMKMRKFNHNHNKKVAVLPADQRKSSTDHQYCSSSSSSAPVSIPAADWSRIYRKNCSRHDYGGGFEDDDDDEEDDMVPLPPHEFLARKVARSQILSFSMCEGVGRTLKGRDLSKVRNSILIQTGFLEQ